MSHQGSSSRPNDVGRRPANYNSQSARPQPQSSVRTSAVHNGKDVHDFAEQQTQHYFSKHRNGPPAYADNNTDPSLALHPRKDPDVGRVQMNGAFPAILGGEPPPPRMTPSPSSGRSGPSPPRAPQKHPIPRKPVPPPKDDPKIGPQPPTRSTTVSGKDIGLKAPVAQPQQAVAGAPRVIHRSADGRFDLSKTSEQSKKFDLGNPQAIHPACRVPMPEATPAAVPTSYPSKKFDLGNPQAVHPACRVPVPEEAPAAVPTSPAEPPSPSDRGRSRKRVNTGSSVRSLSESFKEMGGKIRRASVELAQNCKRVVDAASRNSVERAEYERFETLRAQEIARANSQKRERACQQNTSLRPAHEKEALREKNYHAFQKRKDEGRESAANPYGDDQSDLVFEANQNARDQERKFKQRTANKQPPVDATSGANFRKHRSGTSNSDDSKGSEESDSWKSHRDLTEQERHRSRGETGESYAKINGKTVLDPYVKAGNAIGKVLDPIRAERKRSDESDLGFNDAAPEGSLEDCADCKQATTTRLYHGRCKDCDLKHRQRSQRHSIFVKKWS